MEVNSYVNFEFSIGKNRSAAVTQFSFKSKSGLEERRSKNTSPPLCPEPNTVMVLPFFKYCFLCKYSEEWKICSLEKRSVTLGRLGI